MSDRDLKTLTRVIETRGGFGHREHLELAWTYLGRYEIDTARRVMASAIRHVAGLHGAPDRYHDTITLSWMHLVAVHKRRSEASTFEQFIDDNSDLLNRHLLDRHYSPELLASDEARSRWTQPNLRELPALA